MLNVDRDQLVRGIAAARAGSKDEARTFLEKFLDEDPPIEMRVEAWRCLAELADDIADKRDFIGRILTFDPTDGGARRALAMLDGRLDPADIVNPERPTPLVSSETSAVHGERLACPRCGSGRLIGAAGGRTLVCEHCHYEEPIGRRTDDAAEENRDFAATMWTAKGHRTAERTVAFTCGSCGASFLLPPDVQSLTCPFCGSAHANVEAESREFIAPSALLPFGHSASDVLHTLRSELTEEPVTGPSPVYLPVWMLTFAGSVHWTGYEQDREGFSSRLERTSGEYAVLDHVVLVSGTPRLPEPLAHMVDEFDLSALTPYDPRQLAGYPAATYQITLDEASTLGRHKALAALRPIVKEDVGGIVRLEMTFARVDVDTFKLLLLPFWTAQVGSPNQRRLVFVNGQIGAIGHHASEPGLLSRIAKFTGLFRSDT